ncbi:unnamed protein product [Rhizoctonia solani]|uniref:Coiled-coil domain-containing protein 137 n=1 Tax=Rhizoctonia solani TaxID=456999 RepID=A0A8H3DYF1_9AGAM|nr:unnamed protein product [Rhizoctonia solani]
MPHKRAKRSTREAERKSRQTDLAPSPMSSEPVPKGMARVLDAERVQREYRAQLKKKQADKNESKGIELLPGESLREFNRRVEEVHRPLVRGALKRSKGDEKGKGKRKREEDEEPVREFASVSSSAPKRLREVALAPPVLTKGPRGSGVGKSGDKAPAISMARKVVLEQERERAVKLYRALKASKQPSGESNNGKARIE